MRGKAKPIRREPLNLVLTNILAFNYLIRRETPQIDQVSIKVSEHKDYFRMMSCPLHKKKNHTSFTLNQKLEMIKLCEEGM